MERKSLFKNSIYKSLLSIANIAIPIIIGPYITKLLDVDLYGAYNKVYAEFQIFLIFATFGIYTYGVKEISKIRNDESKLQELFSNLFTISIITNLIVGIFYVLYSVFSSSGITTSIYLLFIIQIVANIFYVEFLNEAFENYKFITIKTVVVKIIYLILLLLFVKKPDDIIVYTIIICFTVFLNNIISYIYIKRKIKFNFKKIHIKQYIKPLLLVLIITNVEILYSQLDRIMLGKFTSDVAVTEYYIPYYLISMLASIPYSIINVSIPRLSYIVETESKERYQEILKTTVSSLLFIIVPMCFGVAVLSKEIIFMYAGDKYNNISGILVLACIIRLIISIESVMTNLVLYVNNKEKKLIKFTFIYGVVNLVLNTILVLFNVLTPFTAMLTTGIAELLLSTTEYLYIKKKLKINISLFTKNNIIYLLLASTFIIIAYVVKLMNLAFLLKVCIIVIVSIAVYVGVLMLLKDQNIEMLKNKLIKKRSEI